MASINSIYNMHFHLVRWGIIIDTVGDFACDWSGHYIEVISDGMCQKSQLEGRE